MAESGEKLGACFQMAKENASAEGDGHVRRKEGSLRKVLGVPGPMLLRGSSLACSPVV